MVSSAMSCGSGDGQASALRNPITLEEAALFYDCGDQLRLASEPAQAHPTHVQRAGQQLRGGICNPHQNLIHRPLITCRPSILQQSPTQLSFWDSGRDQKDLHLFTFDASFPNSGEWWVTQSPPTSSR